MSMNKFVSVAKSLKMILIDLFKGKNAFGQWQNYKTMPLFTISTITLTTLLLQVISMLHLGHVI